MANSPTLHTVPARPSAHAPYTLRTRSAHALHSRAGSQPARLRGLPLARLTQLMRGHAGTSLRQIKCTLGTALPRRAPPLSPSLVTYVCIVRALPSGDARRAGFCCRAPSAPPRGRCRPPRDEARCAAAAAGLSPDHPKAAACPRAAGARPTSCLRRTRRLLEQCLLSGAPRRDSSALSLTRCRSPAAHAGMRQTAGAMGAIER